MRLCVDDGVFERLLEEARVDGIQKVVVGAVIQRGDSFLLLERLASDYMGGLVELPSGGVEADEDLPTALQREVEEETGLSVKSIVGQVGSFDYMSGSDRKTRQFNFRVEVGPGEVRLNPLEHRAFTFVRVSDEVFHALNISDATKTVLNDAFRRGECSLSAKSTSPAEAAR